LKVGDKHLFIVLLFVVQRGDVNDRFYFLYGGGSMNFHLWL